MTTGGDYWVTVDRSTRTETARAEARLPRAPATGSDDRAVCGGPAGRVQGKALRGESELNDAYSVQLIAEIRKLNENVKKIELVLEALHDRLLEKGDDWLSVK